MNRLFGILTFLVLRSASVIGWGMIIVGAFVIGFGTIPALYLLIVHHSQPGDVLPGDRLLAQSEYWKELATQLAVIAAGFLLKDFGRILLHRIQAKTPASAEQP